MGFDLSGGMGKVREIERERRWPYHGMVELGGEDDRDGREHQALVHSLFAWFPLGWFVMQSNWQTSLQTWIGHPDDHVL